MQTVTPRTYKALIKSIPAEDRHTAGLILRAALTPETALDLYLQTPELFDISELSSLQLGRLFSALPEELRPELTSLHPGTRMQLCRECSSMRELMSFTEADLMQVSDRDYVDYLLNAGADAKKLLNAARVKALADVYHRVVFMYHPKWYSTHFGIPALRGRDVAQLVADQPKYAVDNIEQLTEYYVFASTWVDLLRRNYTKASPVFLSKIGRFSPTDVRTVYRAFPILLKNTTVAVIEASKLTAKEWIYLYSSECPAHATAEVLEYLEKSVTVELLSGSKHSRQLRNALDTLRGAFKKDEDAVCQTVA